MGACRSRLDHMTMGGENATKPISPGLDRPDICKSSPAEEMTGTPGAPNATTTVDGRYLPSPPAPFRGQIGLSAKDSRPYWPPQIVPPKGAPNVLLIMTDNVGCGVSGTFGGVIPTPALDRVAQMGLRYTQFHSTALCSPTRAALIHRPQSPFGWLRRRVGAGNRISRDMTR